LLILKKKQQKIKCQFISSQMKKKNDKEAAQFQKHYGSPSMLMKSATK
jgi:hypothetical protein